MYASFSIVAYRTVSNGPAIAISGLLSLRSLDRLRKRLKMTRSSKRWIVLR